MFRIISTSLQILLTCLVVLVATNNPAHAMPPFASDYPDGSAQRKAADFLLANLPENDRSNIPAQALRENIDYAFTARGETPWAASVPFDIFLHYVLPHRLIDEPFKPWRKTFHDQLMPLVRECRTTWEAAVLINLWCVAKVEYHSSSSWLTAPADMFKVGYGRCEELAVLLAAAARSVGIPVRGCWVPGWRHGDDNHVWLEIWDQGKWLPLEAVSTVVDPNENWFLKPARSAPALYSPVYGDVKHPDDPVHRRGTGYTMLNLIGRYAETARFTVAALGRGGQPLREQRVCLWTFNSGMPWIVARTQTDHTGTAHFLAGQGSYIASVGDGEAATAGRVTADCPSVLDLRQKLPETWTWTLDHPQEGPALRRYPTPEAKELQRLQTLASQAKADREIVKGKSLDEARSTFANIPGAPEELLESMERCWPSAPRLAVEYAALSPEERVQVTPLLLEICPKDLALTSLKQLAAHLCRTPAHFSKTNSPKPTDATFYRAKANPRLYREPLAAWGPNFAPLAAKLRKGSIRETATCVIRYLQLLPTTERTAFSCPLTLPQMLASRTRFTRSDKAAFGTALLRSLGIPALVDALNNGIHFLDNGQWRSITLAGGHPVKWATTRLAQEAGGNRLTLLKKNGIFSYVDMNAKEPTTFLPSGDLMVVKMQPLTPMAATGLFQKIPWR